jgi:hypothetical protein
VSSLANSACPRTIKNLQVRYLPYRTLAVDDFYDLVAQWLPFGSSTVISGAAKVVNSPLQKL